MPQDQDDIKGADAMKQAPTPGPLDWDYDKVEMIADLIEKYTYVMSKYNPDLARVAGHNSCAQHILAALAPTAPVEASGSERESIHDAARRLFAKEYPGRDYDRIDASARVGWMESAWEDRTALRPQPSGETRFGDETAEQIVKRWAAWINDASEDMEEPEWGGKTRNDVLNERDFLIRCLSARPLALGGQQGVQERCQRCGGEVQGWLCQSCPAEFRENEDGYLILDDDDKLRDLVKAAQSAKAVLNMVATERRKIGPIATKAQSLAWELNAALDALKSTAAQEGGSK